MNVFTMLVQLRFSRQLFAIIVSIPALIIFSLILYFNSERATPVSPLLLSIVSGAVLLTSILFAILYVRRLSLRIVNIQNCVADLAEGKQRVVSIEGKDEVAAIAVS